MHLVIYVQQAWRDQYRYGSCMNSRISILTVTVGEVSIVLFG